MTYTDLDALLDGLAEENPDAIRLEGLDAAIIGTTNVKNETLLVYDSRAIVDILIQRDGMPYEGAVEFFDFNIAGGAAKGYPLFLCRI